MRKKHALPIKLLIVVMLLAISFVPHATPTRAVSNSRIMDDDVFDDVNSMSESAIRSFINSRPNTCLPELGTAFPEPKDYFNYGPNLVDAARVIYDAAHAWGLNPEVILATLQKEQSLLTDNDCLDPNGYSSVDKAMGLGCYEGPGAQCPLPAYKYFERQVMKGAWQLKFSKERAIGNIMWDGDQNISYTTYYTAGNRQDSISSPLIYRDGYVTLDGQSTYLETGATASLYRYTPHLNQSFPGIFENWFGSTLSPLYYACHNASNINSANGGGHVVPRRVRPGPDDLALVLENKTGSACIEMHTWMNYDYQTWQQNTASNHPAVDPADDEVITADTNGDGVDEFYLVKLRNTDSGKIEIHGWDNTNQHWASNIATNHPAVDPADDRVIAADTNGDGKDEFILVKYRNTASGKIEVHTWLPGLQGWYSNIATNHPAISPADATVIGANTDTDGGTADKLILVKYRNTASGKIEVHTWLPGQQGWYSNVATNHPAVDPGDDEVIAANIFGSKDQLILVKYRNTQSGKIEIHTWGPGQQTWLRNIATNLPTIVP